MDREALIARLREVCHNDAFDVISQQPWSDGDSTDAQLQSIVLLLDDGGVQFLTDIPRNYRGKGDCFFAEDLETQIITHGNRHPTKGTELTAEQRRLVAQAARRSRVQMAAGGGGGLALLRQIYGDDVVPGDLESHIVDQELQSIRYNVMFDHHGPSMQQIWLVHRIEELRLAAHIFPSLEDFHRQVALVNRMRALPPVDVTEPAAPERTLVRLMFHDLVPPNFSNERAVIHVLQLVQDIAAMRRGDLEIGHFWTAFQERRLYHLGVLQYVDHHYATGVSFRTLLRLLM